MGFLVFLDTTEYMFQGFLKEVFETYQKRVSFLQFFQAFYFWTFALTIKKSERFELKKMRQFCKGF